MSSFISVRREFGQLSVSAVQNTDTTVVRSALTLTSQPRITYTGCPTIYQTRQFFNNFTTNEDIATKFEADLPQCVRNMTTSKHVLEVATICVQTGLNPARYILESPCQ